MTQLPPHPSTPPPVIPTQIACPNCGYNLTGVAIGSSCPECGLVIGRGTFSAPNLPTSGKAVASLVLGILAIIGCTGYGIISIPCGIIAMLLAGKVKEQIINQQVAPTSAGLASAGWICGLIGLILGGIGLLFFVFFVIVGLSGGF